MTGADAQGWTPSPARTGIFLVAESISALGSWATIIVVWAYAAFEFDATGTDVALFGLAFGLPGLVVGPFAGAAVDRFGTRKTLAFSKVVGIIAALLMLTADDFRSLALLTTLHGLVHALAMPALQAMPPQLVESDQLARVNALVSLTDEGAMVFGPLLGATAVATLGFQGAFLVDAATYAVGLIALPVARLRPRRHEEQREGIGGILKGWRRIRSSPPLARIVVSTGLVHLLYGSALLVEPLYVRDILQESEEVFALLQTVFGLGLVGGGLIVARAGERLARFSVVVVGLAASAAAALLYLTTPWIGVAFAGSIAWGAATALMSGPSRTLIQREVPESEHGRVLAADLMVGSLSEVAGVGLLGFVVDAVGLRQTIVMLAAVVVTGAAGLAVNARRDQKDEPSSPNEESARTATSAPRAPDRSHDRYSSTNPASTNPASMTSSDVPTKEV